MTDFDIFLDTYDACQDGRQRLAAAGITTLREAYDRAEPQDLIWGITRPGVMTQRDCVRVALHCVETVQDQLADERSRAVIPLLCRWLDDPSTVSVEELDAADRAARPADTHATAWDAWDADRAAAWAARAARVAPSNATDRGAAAYAAYATAWAAWDARAAWADASAAWIRENIPFETLHTN